MTQHTPLLSETQSADAMLRARARLVVPGGMWGHLNAARLPDGYPQFFASAEGCRVRDDRWPRIHRLHVQLGADPAGPSASRGSGGGGRKPSRETASTVRVRFHGGTRRRSRRHAAACRLGDVSKNGGDATACCVTISARRHRTPQGAGRAWQLSRRAAMVLAKCCGVTAEDRAHLLHFEYNDAQSLRAAVEAAGKDLAAILVTAFRHDMGPRSRTADEGIRGSRACGMRRGRRSLDYR